MPIATYFLINQSLIDNTCHADHQSERVKEFVSLLNWGVPFSPEPELKTTAYDRFMMRIRIPGLTACTTSGSFTRRVWVSEVNPTSTV
jgi:hypothetical protein